MSRSNTGFEDKPLASLVAVVFGFFLADIAIVLLRAPGLLNPSHWSGFGVLLMSGLVLYVSVLLYFIVFYVMVWIIFRIFRLRMSGSALALITAFSAPLFLIVQNSLQRSMLGTFTSFRHPFFYVPTGIAIAIVLAVMLIVFAATRGREAPGWARKVFGWRGLILIAFCVFFLHGTLKITPVNVLGVFTADQKRMPKGEHPAPALDGTAAQGPNFIVLTIEALRADEFTRDNAPFLYDLAQDNIWFSRYYTVASSTRPSVTSFFTSLYPAQHGCYNLALGQKKAGEQPSSTCKVVQTIQTLPMLLQERGYRTLMATSNLLTIDRMFGCGEVYCRFDAVEPYRFKPLSFDVFVGYRHLYLWLGGWRVLKAIVTPPDHSRVYFDAPRVNATIREELERWVAGEDKRPFFLYAHYMEPHSPYYFHPYRPLQLNLYSAAKRESILAAYRSEIKAVDAAVADLYAFLEENGLLENTYVFIVADHGEEFLDHGDWGHGKSMYPEVISVPAILVPPAGQQMEQLVEVPVENIDIMPTFAEIAGIPVPDYWEGRSVVSLISRAEGEAGDTGGPHVAFGQFRDDFGRFWATAITDDGWQVVFKEPARLKDAPEQERRQKRKIMLFNLVEDPQAKRNLAGEGMATETPLVALLEENLRRLELTAHLYQGEEEEIDSKALEQLKALGYIQ